MPSTFLHQNVSLEKLNPLLDLIILEVHNIGPHAKIIMEMSVLPIQISWMTIFTAVQTAIVQLNILHMQ